MINLGMYSISKNRKYGKKLMKDYKFPDLLCNEEDCETYYNYCKKKKTGIVNPFYLFKDGDGV